ncbi:hypothetical protein BKI52_07740 [marine bacterium AO1-C]|nr:hypothetical protein BKI52_07740 [marine bacterium AO1-C]
MLEVDLRFGTLFTVAVEHNYLADRQKGNFSLEPSKYTQYIMNKLGLYYKSAARAMVFAHHDLDALKFFVKKNAGIKFSFWLFHKEPYFSNYTSLNPEKLRQNIIYLSNLYSDDMKSTLHMKDFVSDADCYDVNYGQVPFPSVKKSTQVQLLNEYTDVIHSQDLEPEQSFSFRDRNLEDGNYTLVANGERKSFLYFSDIQVPRPLAWIEIRWDEKMLDNIVSQLESARVNEPYNFIVSFEERKTTWRYTIIPKYENPSNLKIRMVEGREKVTFTGPVEGKFYNQQAYIFESDRPLSLKERPDYEFELVSGSKIIKKMLPAPSPELIKPTTDNSKFYSEIIVYI